MDARHVDECFMMFRRTAFEECGGFDIRYPSYYGDADIVLRLRKLGFRAILVDTATATRAVPQAPDDTPEAALLEFYAGLLTFHRVHWYRSYKRMRWLIPLTFRLSAFFAPKPAADSLRDLRRSITSLCTRPHRHTLPEHPSVSVIIPTKDRRDLLSNLLEMLRAQTYPDFEVIIVDQDTASGPMHESGQLALEPRWSVIRASISGRSHARNVGARHATGELLLFLDDDISIPPDLIQRHVHSYLDTSIGGVTFRILEPGIPHSEGIDIMRITAYGRVIAGYQADVHRAVEFLTGGNMSVPASILRHVGEFDPSLGGTSVFEEPDLCFRMRGEGFRLLFSNATTVTHTAALEGNREARARQTAQYYRWIHHNEILYFLKNRSPHLLVMAIPFCFLRSLRLMSNFRLTIRDAWNMFAGVFDGLATFNRLYR
jgi:GT2 family glycosyltransferase